MVARQVLENLMMMMMFLFFSILSWTEETLPVVHSSWASLLLPLE
jgi:hypothetical protein